MIKKQKCVCVIERKGGSERELTIEVMIKCLDHYSVNSILCSSVQFFVLEFLDFTLFENSSSHVSFFSISGKN